jgi:hypothetical protein
MTSWCVWRYDQPHAARRPRGGPERVQLEADVPESYLRSVKVRAHR